MRSGQRVRENGFGRKLDAAIKDYIEGGGEIEKLPTIEQGALTMIQDEMMQAGF